MIGFSDGGCPTNPRIAEPSLTEAGGGDDVTIVGEGKAVGVTAGVERGVDVGSTVSCDKAVAVGDGAGVTVIA